MRIGNVVRWDGSLWVVSEWDRNDNAQDRTRATLVSLLREGTRVRLTGEHPLGFSVRDVALVASTVEEFVVDNMRGVLFSPGGA